MPPRRLIFFTTDMEGGGAQRVLRDLAIYFSSRGHEVHLILKHQRGQLLATLPTEITLHVLRHRLALLHLTHLLRRLKPDATLATLRPANCLLALAARLARLRCPVLLREATLIDAQWRCMPRHKRWRQQWALRRYYPLAEHIIVMSQPMADNVVLRTGIAQDRCIILPNPAITDAMLTEARESPLHPWLEPNAPPLILGAGRLSHEKGFDILLSAFALLAKEQPCRLMLLGDGPLRGALERQAEKLGITDHVTLPGFVSNPFAYMARASLFVLPSRFEGMPNALIQALACGCPVVATDCGSGSAEILGHPPLVPLVQPENPLALAEAMRSQLHNPTPQNILKERGMAFHIDRIAPLYGELLGLGQINA